MKYNPDIHHRRSIRLKDYDYSQAGAYFVTVRTQKPEFLLGEIEHSKMKLSPIGEIVQNEWEKLRHRFPDTHLDEFVVMPNHVHGIIIVGAALVAALNNRINQNVGAPLVGAQKKRAGTRPAPTLGDIVGAFKSLCVQSCVNKRYNVGKLWQRNYYEHIVRNEESLNKIRECVANNPQRWEFDRNNPNHVGIDDFDRWLDTFKKPPEKS